MTPQQLIEKWRPALERTQHIFSWSGDAELAYWAECATKANRILEVGCNFGRSTKMMALANPNAHIGCIDDWAQPGVLRTFRHFLSNEINSGRFFLLQGEASKLLASIPDRNPFDLIVLDNGHEESELLSQIPLAIALLSKSGLLCGHDLDRNPDNGVTKAVKKLLPNFTEPVPRVWAWTKPK